MQRPIGLRSTRPVQQRTEILAGLTLAAIGIPEVIGYSTIAGMPVLTGILTMVLPLLVYVWFGGSRHLVVGADSATAAIMAAGLVGIAAQGTANYVAIAGLLAGFTAIWLLVARLLDLGFIANFLSQTVLVGFLIGIGVSVAVGQLPHMLGLHIHSSGTLGTLVATVQHFGSISWVTTGVSVGAVTLFLGLRRFKRVPIALIVLVGSIAVSSATDLTSHGIELIGPISGSVFHLQLPSVPRGSWSTLITVSLSMALVILSQSAATSRAYASRYDEEYEPNRDLLALGLSNLASMASGAYVVNGSPTKTEIIDEAGSRTQWAAVVASGVALLALLVLKKPLEYLPEAILAAVVFTIAVHLIRLGEIRAIARHRKDEAVVAIGTAVAVVVLGVELGILVSVIVALVNHVRRGYDPKNFLMEIDATGAWVAHPFDDEVAIVPGVYLYRFQASLYYANAPKFVEEVWHLATVHHPRCIIVDASAIADIDNSAGLDLGSLAKRLEEAAIPLIFTHVVDEVESQLISYGVLSHKNVEIGDDTRELLDRYR